MKPSALFLKRGGTACLSDAALFQLMSATLEKGAAFRFKARGFSMAPFIKDGDILTLSPLWRSPLRTGDIIAIVVPSTNRIAVHRLVRKMGSLYLVKGDNTHHPDGYIHRKDILGHLTRVARRGKNKHIGFGPERHLIALTSRTGILIRIVSIFKKILLPCHRIYSYE